MTMKTAIGAAMILAACNLASAANLYVWTNSPFPGPPYNAWSNAARVIQDAVDAAAPGDTVWVTNGVYETGGRVMAGAMTNRVAVDKPIALRSVNGPAVTVIRGRKPPANNAVRCVYLTNGASLAGFTLTNGATRTEGSVNLEQTGGGSWCAGTDAILSNCVISGCSAYNGGAGVAWGTLRDCVIQVNTSGIWGGGSYYSTLRDCALRGNGAGYGGGGALNGSLSNCVVISNISGRDGGGTANALLQYCLVESNRASQLGGGVANCIISNCVLRGNRANTGGGAANGEVYFSTLAENCATGFGGGAFGAHLYNSMLTGNRGSHGGGARVSTLENCMLTANVATNEGGGAFDSALYHCTLVDNYAPVGGGAFSGTLYNCIAYYNRADSADASNSYRAGLTACCTTPLPPAGAGHITNEPLIACLSNPRLLPGSPCVDAANAGHTVGDFDFEGEPRIHNLPDIGCDELWENALTGSMALVVSASQTNALTPGVAVAFGMEVAGKPEGHAWSFGDGAGASNRFAETHTFPTAGVFAVVLRAQNLDGAACATVVVEVTGGFTNYVSPSGSNEPPFASWAAAATTLQAAADAAYAGGVVLVGSGVYDNGGRAVDGTLTNRIAIDRPLTVRAVNGPESTIIHGKRGAGGTVGDGAIRCAWIASGGTLSGFTLTGGATRVAGDLLRERSGGGAWCESADAVIADCVLAGNLAADHGGGAVGGTLSNTIVRNNRAPHDGGGLYYGAAVACALISNRAERGGGAFLSRLADCMVATNYAVYGGGMFGGEAVSCVITGNFAEYAGGGALGDFDADCRLDRCVLEGNTAGQIGGGAALARLVNCLAHGNRAAMSGGGLYGGSGLFCTIAGNSAMLAGGMHMGGLTNSIVYGNQASGGSNYNGTTMRYCCAAPLAPGAGNTAADPAFLAQAADRYALTYGSPCVDQGEDIPAVTNDLEGCFRPVDGTFDGSSRYDMGAFEYDPTRSDSDSDRMPDDWEHYHGLNPTNAADAWEHADTDRMVNRDEYVADTDPRDANSYFRIEGFELANGAVLAFESSSNRVYSLQYAAGPSSEVWQSVKGQTNRPGSGGIISMQDTNVLPTGFHRLTVAVP